MKRAALAAAVLLFASPSFAAPLDAFTQAFGEAGLKTLTERGYLVLQGSGAGRRLAAVHWKALEGLAAVAGACKKLDHDFGSCRVLPPDGAMTPRLHALADAIVAEDQERFALESSSSSRTEPAGLPNLFETKWGAELAARRRADLVEDPAGLAKSYFEDELTGPRPNAEAVKHFAAVMGPEAAAKLASDAVRGAASDDLRALIRRYLQDERRRRGLALAHARMAALTSDKDTRRELDALTALAAALSSRPGLLSSLEAAVSGAPAPGGAPKLRSAGIHLWAPTRLGQHELGDEAVVSGAYWVDGLDEGASIDVDETVFIETSRSFSAVESRAVRRKNGGPYPYERRVTIDQTRPFAFVALVSAVSGSVVAERAEVPVAPDFELSLKREAEALQASQSCDPKAAEAIYSQLSELIAEAAKVKPQYRALLERTRRGKAKAAEDAAALAKLTQAVAASRPDATAQQCAYDAGRTDAAIALARRLPPGCDGQFLPDLFAQRSLISRRAADQKWFLRASSNARSRRRSCDFAGASEQWTAALAVLEADPSARCGKVDEEAKAAEGDLIQVRRARLWSETLNKSLDKAENTVAPAERLAMLAPALARLNTLDDHDCRRDAIKRAERLVEKAGSDEAGPTDDEAKRRLPADSTAAAVTGQVRGARAGGADSAPAPAASTEGEPPLPGSSTPPASAKPATVQQEEFR